MPTYEYQCSACGHAFEHLQSMTEARLTDCPACKQKKLARLIGSGSGVIFKGSGFYETDYKRKDNSSGKKPEAKSEPAACPACPMKESGGCGAG